MKHVLALLVVAILAGCASPLDSRSAGHIVIPANTRLGQTDWVPAEAEILDIEIQLGDLFLNPDSRISGLTDSPPYPLKDYVIRYSVTGPKDSSFLVGEAVHKSRPEAASQLDAQQPSFDPKTVKGPTYFTFLYDVKIGRIREVLFSRP